jgi:hypothetical protein
VKRCAYAVAVAVLAALWTRSVWAEDPKEKPLVDKVRDAIERGVQFLREQENGSGNWENIDMPSNQYEGGWTSLALLALMNSGVKPDDPIIQRGLKYLRTVPPKKTYVVGLQIMVFAAAGDPADKERIQRNVDWLISNRLFNNGGGARTFEGWNYGPDVPGFASGDNSNTQYALLGLHEGQLAGAKIDREVWKLIQDYYIRTQKFDERGYGGWGYARSIATVPVFTMTTAGLCGLLIAGLELNSGREVLQPNGNAIGCGIYAENRPATAALGWISSRFRVEDVHAIFYSLYGIERAGRLTGQRFFGHHDWYREGCQYLVDRQTPSGAWTSATGQDHWKVVATSFALLFLSKGRTPVTISKLVHGPDEDWNNDHNDAKNLVDYASRELFKRQPLAWQIFDAKRGLIENSREELLGLVGDLLQSPIAYFNGHRAPRFTQAEEDLLKEYVEQGGFILAEACCGREEFDRGFRDLMKRLFPDTPLRPLGPDHPIWKSHALINPGEFKLEGIEKGCKTVVVYSPEDLSCLWESNQFASGRSALAFRLGANIVAYATGMELPKPRLTASEVIADETETKKVPRGYLKVAQLRHEGDWQPAPRAMPNLMHQLQDKVRLLVSLQAEPVYPGQESVLDYKFLYMHGRNAFSLGNDPRALANLRSNLQTGGLLFADACCGKKPFDTSFRAFMTQLFPDKKLERIPLNDELFSKELNGTSITTVRCRRENADASGADPSFRQVEPYLEGIKINNRWVVIYSKYDIGCALEKHQSTDCLGHDYPSAIKIGTAAVLYALNR